MNFLWTILLEKLKVKTLIISYNIKIKFEYKKFNEWAGRYMDAIFVELEKWSELVFMATVL